MIIDTTSEVGSINLPALKFNSLPPEIWNHVISFCLIEDISELSLASKEFTPLFQMKFRPDSFIEEYKKEEISKIELRDQNTRHLYSMTKISPTGDLASSFGIVVFLIGAVAVYALHLEHPVDVCDQSINDYNDGLVKYVMCPAILLMILAISISNLESVNKRVLSSMKRIELNQVSEQEQKILKIFESRKYD